MSFSQFLAVLRARWVLIVSIMSAVVVVTMAVALSLPKQYTATASVVIDPKGGDALGGGAYPVGPAALAYMATQVEMMGSLRVAERVVKGLSPEATVKLRGLWKTKGSKGNFENWVAKNLREALKVLPSRESNVIGVSFTAEEPAFAANMANAFVKAYVETAISIRVQPAKEYKTFFEAQVKEARERLDQAQTKLNTYQQANGILVTDERLDVESTRLNSISQELVTQQALLADSKSRASQSRANSNSTQEVLSSPVVQGLRTELQRAQTTLGELRERFGEAHPQVIETRRRVEELNSRIRDETSRVSGGVTVSNNVMVEKVNSLKALLEEQRQRVMKLRNARSEADVLLKDVEGAQKNYDAVYARLSQTSIESQSAQGNASSLELAVPPTEPSGLKLRVALAISIFAGILLGVIAAIARELMDRRVRVEEEIPMLIGQPVLGAVPAFSKTKALGISNRRLAISGSMKRLPAP